MKKRQIKKNSNTAKKLLMQLNPRIYTEKVFIKNTEGDCDSPEGTWEIWNRTSYEYDEWDAETAFDVLRNLIFWDLTVSEYDVGLDELVLLSKPDTSTAKKVFDLAKHLIVEACL